MARLCKNGHEISGENVRPMTQRGKTVELCRQCRNESAKAAMRRKREKPGAKVCSKGHIWNSLETKQCMKCKIAHMVIYNRTKRRENKRPVFVRRGPYVPDANDAAVQLVIRERARVLAKRAEHGAQWWKVAA
jgi:hypothetical protein